MAMKKITGCMLNNFNSFLIPHRSMSGKFVNEVFLLGRCGKEPIQATGTQLRVFPLYTEHFHRKKDGTTKITPSWHRIVTLGGFLSESVLPLLERGQRVYVRGRLQYSKSEDNPLEQRAYVVAEHVVLLERSKKQQNLEEGEGEGEREPEPPKEHEAAQLQ